MKFVHLIVGRGFSLLIVIACCAGARAQSDLPDAPAPVVTAVASTADDLAHAAPVGPAGPVVDTAVTPAVTALPGDAADPEGQQTFPPFAPRNRPLRLRGLQSGYLPEPTECVTQFCSQAPPRRSCCVQSIDTFAEYLRQNAVHTYTPTDLARMAVHGVIDPFNLLTIVGTSAISVAADSHSPYGPGGYGFAKLSGVALTQDMTNAFVETFLIPSIDHQDPLFHRMPNASLTRRIAHCIYQPVWTDSMSGRGMVNYATLAGDVVDEAVWSSYVPYQRKGWGPGADRVAVNIATTPIGNVVTEFLPDVARHVNFSVVFVQRVINRVAAEEAAGGPSAVQ